MDNKNERISLLWTGGWDSTFRLLQLLFVENLPVQTTYIIDLQRRSTHRELEAMAGIRGEILRRLNDPDFFPPTNIYLKDHFPCYPDIAEAHKRIRASTTIGKQYEWLACYARFTDLSDIELCMHWLEPLPSLHKYIFDNVDLENRRTATLNPSHDVQCIFGRFKFPLLHFTKAEMGEHAENNGFLDVLQQSWFCHKPILGKPCGSCTPCRVSIEQGRNIKYSRLTKFTTKISFLRRMLR
jgi:hypothetical protein